MIDWIDEQLYSVRGAIGRCLFRLACWIDGDTEHWVRQHEEAGKVMSDFVRGNIDEKEARQRGYAAFY